MPYVTPVPWALQTTPSSAQITQEMITNLTSLRAMNDVSIRVHRTAVQSIPNNTRLGTAHITWQAASYQTGITWSAGTTPTRLIVPTAGLYLLATNIKFANVVGGRRGVGWRMNGSGTAWDQQTHPGNGVDTVNGIEIIEFTAADITAGGYIEVWGFQNTGGAINTVGTTEGDCWAALSLLSTGTTDPPVWVPPITTWVDGFPAGTFMSPARVKTEIMDKVNNLRNLKGLGAKVWMSDDQSISSGKREMITWDRAVRNVGGLWDGGARFVAPIAGVYLVLIDLEWADSGAAAVMGTGYRKNDRTNHDLQMQQGDANGENQSGGDLIFLKKGEDLQIYAYQDSPNESLSVHGGSQDRSRASITLWASAT